MATSKSYRSMPSSNISKFSNDNSGLLTTVADLPYNFKLQYVSVETPLDLSLKSVLGQITPPHSPQRSPLKKRPYPHVIETNIVKTEDDASKKTTKIKNDTDSDVEPPPAKLVKKEVTPNGKQIKVTSMPKTQKSVSVNKTAPVATTVKEHKRVKAVRKLKFDEKKSSPVSGTIIRALDEIDGNIPQESGDIDPQYNIVEVTEEAKAEIAAIPNVIGAYLCKLCQIEFDDAFCLARHRCSCIVLLEYRCPECGKRFNCPANLASHRRWHKPKEEVMKKSSDSNGSGDAGDENAIQYPCNLCGKFFKRQAYLRKHLVTHNKPNSKTNKRTVLSASDSNDDGKSTDANSQNGNAIATKNSRTNNHATNKSGRSKSVCSDDSVSSSQDSIASSVRFTFNVNSSNDVNNDNKIRDYDEVQPSSSPTHFRLFKSEIFTEEENIAAAALAHLRHAKDSVIRHTTALST
ncbi:asparagine-rich zinc finger protein AZF1 [Contarinia nasturtii]|uniref:asparagine-rich zinc finger protein AZF1 n=1 Tax=Contarinia nasturtii TaxID=265458 RepID=UPI0012D3AD16|nr:asparagine-rich zinc finger protein AZF1 [Contarinia nasturtii]